MVLSDLSCYQPLSKAFRWFGFILLAETESFKAERMLPRKQRSRDDDEKMTNVLTAHNPHVGSNGW